MVALYSCFRFNAGFHLDKPGNDGIKKDCVGALLAKDKELRIYRTTRREWPDFDNMVADSPIVASANWTFGCFSPILSNPVYCLHIIDLHQGNTVQILVIF